VLIQPRSELISMPVLFLGIATFAPLVRYPLSALALDWNRHR
jgi:hypothetical protein